MNPDDIIGEDDRVPITMKDYINGVGSIQDNTGGVQGQLIHSHDHSGNYIGSSSMSDDMSDAFGYNIYTNHTHQVPIGSATEGVIEEKKEPEHYDSIRLTKYDILSIDHNRGIFCDAINFGTLVIHSKSDGILIFQYPEVTHKPLYGYNYNKITKMFEPLNRYLTSQYTGISNDKTLLDVFKLYKYNMDDIIDANVYNKEDFIKFLSWDEDVKVAWLTYHLEKNSKKK